MSIRNVHRESGQTLVQVAIVMFLLLAIISLAIDVGNVYAQRRRMQNAADAGALAGAYEICFGDRGAWETTAVDYAINRNGAETALAIQPTEWSVRVTAQETVETFLAGIVGISTVDVAAVAEAECGNANSLCNLWPLTFHVERWERVGCGEEFYVFNDSRFEEDDPCAIPNPECMPLCDTVIDGQPVEGACVCAGVPIPPDNVVHVIGPGHRAWVNFPKPEKPFTGEELCNNCGEQVRCWIQHDGYDARFVLDPIKGTCIPGNPGVRENVRKEIGKYHIGDTPHILIWDGNCDSEDAVGQCKSPYNYHVVSTGCVEITQVTEIDLERKAEFSPPEYCLQNVKTIKARKLCECTSECGSTVGGGPPTPDQVHAVSLTQ